MVELRCVHLNVTKHVMMYVKGIVDYGFIYVSNHEIRLQGYIDLELGQ